MKMFKRLICLALVAILCIGLVACGGSGKTEVSAPPSSEDTGSHREPYKEEEPKVDEPVKVEVKEDIVEDVKSEEEPQSDKVKQQNKQQKNNYKKR